MAQLAAAFATDPQPAFERRSAEDCTHRPKSYLHELSPVPRPQCGSESVVPQLAKSTHEIREKLHSALKRRIGIGKPVNVKVVARATGLTERTIENAMSGETMPRGDTLMALIDFFDASFANEIFAGTTFMVVKLSDQRAADAARMINDGVAALQALARRA